MDWLQNYVVVVVMAICVCMGYIIKNFIPGKKINRYIPLVMGILGVFFNVWVNAWSINPEIVLGGLISGLASTGAYEMFRNFINKK